MATVLGVRIPASALHLPPAIKPRCSHTQAIGKMSCPACGISADVESQGQLVPDFDGRTLCGYNSTRSGDFYFVGVTVGEGYSLTLDGFAELWVKMRDKLQAVAGAWGGNFGVWNFKE